MEAKALALVPHGDRGHRPEDEATGLPYIDTLSVEEKAAVDVLIEEEAFKGPKQPGDYLKELPPMPTIKFQGRAALQAEWARVRAGQPMDKLAFGNTMAPEPPQPQQNSVPAWRSALDNAGAQLEHQHNWLLNLELAQKYAPKSWQANVASLDAAHKRLSDDVAETDRQIEAVNVARSLKQKSAAAQLQDLEAQWAAQVVNNQMIEGACQALERQIAQAQQSNVVAS